MPGDGGAAPGALDLAKAARLLADVADIGAEADLSGLGAAAADDELLRTADQQVHAQAEVRRLPRLLQHNGALDRHVRAERAHARRPLMLGAKPRCLHLSMLWCLVMTGFYGGASQRTSSRALMRRWPAVFYLCANAVSSRGSDAVDACAGGAARRHGSS